MKKRPYVYPLIAILTLTLFVCAFTIKRNNPKHNSIQATAHPEFLVVSDIHWHTGVQHDNNDTDDSLWNAAKEKITGLLSGSNGAKPKFLIILGDLPYHIQDDFSDIKQVGHAIDATHADLTGLASKANIPMIIVPGNNDSYDGDYHPLNPKHEFSLFLTGATGEMADQAHIDKGFYSAYPLGKKEKFRVIVLNTVIFSNKNIGNLSYGPDKQAHATIQLDWLKKQLADVSEKGESALIAMHIPPGKDGYFGKNPNVINDLWDKNLQYRGKPVQNAFVDMVDDYKNNIIGLLASHTHMDGIRVISKDKRSVSSILISIPGIAPGHRNNPSMKMISYDPKKSFELEGFTTYYMNFWNCKGGCPVSKFDQQLTFQHEFGGDKPGPIKSTLTGLFTKDKAALIKDVSNIYTVGNGSPSALKNNVDTTIVVTGQ